MGIRKYLSELIGVFLVLAMLGCIWLWGYSAGNHRHSDVVYRDSILVKDSIIIDSIFVENKILETKIKYIEKEYEDQVSDIVHNADSTNYILFTDYLRTYERSIADN